MIIRNENGRFVKGSQTWFGKSLPTEMKERISETSKGKHYSLKTEFKKGHPYGKRIKKGQHLSLKTQIKEGNISHNKGMIGFLEKEKHWNWKGGITPIQQKIRNSLEYKDWTKIVYKRDYYTCQDCGYKGKEIVAHHKKSFADYPKLRFKKENGITLCRKCHMSIHMKKLITACS